MGVASGGASERHVKGKERFRGGVFWGVSTSERWEGEVAGGVLGRGGDESVEKGRGDWRREGEQEGDEKGEEVGVRKGEQQEDAGEEGEVKGEEEGDAQGGKVEAGEEDAKEDSPTPSLPSFPSPLSPPPL